jgi:tRNA(Ile)-lysidine synthase TilS/MesJ
MADIIYTITNLVVIRSILIVEDKLELYKVVYKFAYSTDGMNKNSSGAEAFADNWVENWFRYDFKEYAIIYLFAYSSSGMNRNRSEAERFAFRWLQKAYRKDVEAFAKWYLFAYSSSGMNKNSSEAEEFALQKII